MIQCQLIEITIQAGKNPSRRILKGDMSVAEAMKEWSRLEAGKGSPKKGKVVYHMVKSQ